MNNAVCDLCKKAFPSHAHMLSHRRIIHKWQRKELVEIEELLKLEHDARLDEIDYIIYHNKASKEHKFAFTNSDAEWITVLNDNHPKVVKYFQKTKTNVQILDANKGEWMQPT